MQITINLPAVAVVEPTTTYSADISKLANANATNVSVPLGSIENNGNVTRTLKLTVSNPVNCIVTSVGIKNPVTAVIDYAQGDTQSMVLPKGKSAEAIIDFGVVPNQPGSGSSVASATLTTEWV